MIKLRNLIKEDSKLFQIKEESASTYMTKLERILESAIPVAEMIGSMGQRHDFEDNFRGMPAEDIAALLEDIYAAIMTGDRKDKSYNDQLFK